VNARKKFPSKKIYICKVDLDAAYRRCTLASSTSFESMTIYDNLLLVALRLTFGGSPCPSLWGLLSETMADIANTLLVNPFWDHDSVFDPISNMIEPPQPLPVDQPFHSVKDLSVSIPTNPIQYIDIFINDFIGVTLDLGGQHIQTTKGDISGNTYIDSSFG